MSEKDLEKEAKDNESKETLDKETKEAKADDSEKEVKEETPEEVIAKLEKDLEEWKSSYTRKLAEFQNFTKRKENEVAEMKKYASEGIITKLLFINCYHRWSNNFSFQFISFLKHFHNNIIV